jgi:putative protease
MEVCTKEQLDYALSCRQLEYVYAPLRLLSPETPDKDRIIVVPDVFDGEIPDMGFNRVLVHTINHIKAGMILHGGFRLNITNSTALRQYEQLGLTDSVLSIELSLHRAKSMTHSIPIGIIAYGRLPMMLMRRLVRANGLIDRRNRFMPFAGNELLNSDTLILSDRVSDFDFLDFMVLKLTDENPSDVLEMYLNFSKPAQNFTRGLYYK